MSARKLDRISSEELKSSKENIETPEESAIDISECSHDAQALSVTEEDAYDTDLEPDEPGIKHYRSMTAEDIYVKACEHHGVVPASYFIAHMFDEVMNMSHHGLGPNGTKAIAAPLVVNTSIVDLNLEDNWITSEGMNEMALMLMENCYIASLNLAGNKLATDGARFVCEMIQENTNLRELNLSRNDFKDSDAQYFAESLRQNFRLKHLNLSGNSFCELGGEWLGQAIVNNEAVEYLNLSWNHLRRRGALAVCAGMKSNITIKYLDLSWNGFADDGAMAMGIALKTNNSLIWLDLSNNRISDKGAAMLAKGLEINDSLKTLKIGNNPMGSQGGVALLRAIMKNENSAMEELDIKGVQVNEEFLKLAQELKEKIAALGGSKTNFFLTMNSVDTTSQVKRKPSTVAPSTDDPMQILQKFLEDKRLRLVDLFRNFDKDLSWKISPAEFKKGILDSGISLTTAQLTGLMKNLDIDIDGQVNYSELLAGKKEAILRRREMLRKEAQMKAKIEEKKKEEAEKFVSAWQDAVHISVTPRSSVGPTPNHTPLRSRSLVVPKRQADDAQNDVISQAAAKLRQEKTVPFMSKSFAVESNRLGSEMNSKFYSLQTSFQDYQQTSDTNSDVVEVSIEVPVAKLAGQSPVEGNLYSTPVEFEQKRHTSGTPNSRKTPFSLSSKT